MSKIDAEDVGKEGQAEVEVKPGDTVGEGTILTNGVVPLTPGPDADV